ncbi:MAG: DUF167 family protein [Promethearchaeota archaeon]|jgi:uncharacterized protein (TIGR00251 family)
MNLIEKKSDTIFILKIVVKPNSQTQEILIENDYDYILIKLTSKPFLNKANKELLKLLKKKLEINLNQIKFISGFKSRSKLIQISYYKKTDEKDILEKLLD